MFEETEDDNGHVSRIWDTEPQKAFDQQLVDERYIFPMQVVATSECPGGDREAWIEGIETCWLPEVMVIVGTPGVGGYEHAICMN